MDDMEKSDEENIQGNPSNSQWIDRWSAQRSPLSNEVKTLQAHFSLNTHQKHTDTLPTEQPQSCHSPG